MTYVPKGQAPTTLEELARYVTEELEEIAAAFLVVEHIELIELHVEPDRPRDGLIVLADGTNWNPGSGAGYYGYHNAAWKFLG